MPPINSQLGVAQIRALAAEIADRADEADRLGRLPPEDIQALRAAGYLALSVPAEYGGGGLSLRDCAAAQLELAAGSASTALVAAMSLQVFGHARESRPWPEAAFERLCRAAAAGAVVNSAASEPALGSPSRGAFFQTRAERDGDAWLITGHKTWTTGGQHLTHLLVKLDVEGEPGTILVPADAPGVEWVDTWGDSLSLRASDSHDVYFRRVRVPADHLLERGRREDRVPNAWFPLMVAATYLGTARAARDAVIRYALERVPTALGKPIAALPQIQRQIGELDVALQAAELLLLDAAAAWPGDETGRAVYPRIVAAKHLATETALRVTDAALRIAGGAGLTRGLPLERCFRDVRAGLMHPPAGDTALEIVGQNAIDRLKGNGRG